MRNLLIIFLLFCYARVTRGQGNVTFASRNFYNVLTWDPAPPSVPGQTVRYSVSYGVIDNEEFHLKAECQEITELFCDLTEQTPAVHDTYYRARVFADGSLHGTTRNFKPIAETVLGAPSLAFKTSRTSLHMDVTLPVGPKDEPFLDIIIANHKGASEAVIIYSLSITKPQWARRKIENTTGHFDVSLDNKEKEFCGFVEYTPVHETGRPLSEKAFFCAEPQGDPWISVPWLVVGAVVAVAVVLVAACFAMHSVKNVKNIEPPQSLEVKTHPPQLMHPQKQNISRLEMATRGEETGYATIQVKPNVLSEDGLYLHKNTMFEHYNEDSSDTIRLCSPRLHDQDSSAQSSENYGAVAVEVFPQSQLPQTDRNDTLLLPNGKDVDETKHLLSAINTSPLSGVDLDDYNSQTLFLQTLKDSEGKLILPSFQVPVIFTGATEELVPTVRKPLLSYLIVSSDKGENMVSMDSLESSDCSDSGLEENSLLTPTPDSDLGPIHPDSSPDLQSPVSCDSGYKQNWMPPLNLKTHHTSYPWTWSGQKDQ